MLTNLLNKLKHPALAELIKDQHLKELITRREFRLSEEFQDGEIVGRLGVVQ